MIETFISKFQPIEFKDFELNDELLKMFDMLIRMDNLNIMLYAYLYL